MVINWISNNYFQVQANRIIDNVRAHKLALLSIHFVASLSTTVIAGAVHENSIGKSIVLYSAVTGVGLDLLMLVRLYLDRINDYVSNSSPQDIEINDRSMYIRMG